MLILTRKNHESIVVGDSSCPDHVLTVTVLDVKLGKVRLGFETHRDVPIYRSEVWERVCGDDPSGYGLPVCRGTKVVRRIGARSHNT